MIPDSIGKEIKEMDAKFVHGFVTAFVDNDKEELQKMIRKPAGITWNRKR